MKKICLYFEIHQIVHLKRYRFFDIGTDHYYYDDYENERSVNDTVERSYMPALNTIGKMIEENGDFFKVAFSLSGVGIEQLEVHAPQVLEKLQELNSDDEAKRSHNVTLQHLEVVKAKEGLFNDWLKQKGRLGGQHKVPRLSNSRKNMDELLEMNKG